MRATIKGTIRYDSADQLRRLKAAADLMHWPLYRFLLIAGERMATRVLKGTKQFESVQEG